MNTLDILRQAANEACGCNEDYDWCGFCGRATCHRGEHTTGQVLEFVALHGGDVDREAAKIARNIERFFRPYGLGMGW